jgi:anti-sigma B factor antagonist
VIESPVSAMDGSGGSAMCRPVFEIRQRHDADGALRVTLIGELDLAVADRLRARLGQLRHASRRIRLDLSQLEFIDCSGVGGILSALAEARCNRWEMEVDRLVSPSVRRLTAVEEIASALWPGEVPTRAPAAAMR